LCIEAEKEKASIDMSESVRVRGQQNGQNAARIMFSSGLKTKRPRDDP
jgi:hypothetical protein